MANLIICPVGSEMPHDPRWKKEDHWRWTHNDRDYKTLVVVYNDFKSNVNKLAAEVLCEVPTQVEQYYRQYRNFKGKQ